MGRKKQVMGQEKIGEKFSGTWEMGDEGGDRGCSLDIGRRCGEEGKETLLGGISTTDMGREPGEKLSLLHRLTQLDVILAHLMPGGKLAARGIGIRPGTLGDDGEGREAIGSDTLPGNHYYPIEATAGDGIEVSNEEFALGNHHPNHLDLPFNLLLCLDEVLGNTGDPAGGSGSGGNLHGACLCVRG
jgi:hypothetical protein